MSARGERAKLGDMLTRTTRYAVLTLLALGLPIVVYAQPLLTLWVGPTYASQAAPLLRVLMVANIVRLSAVPYSVLVVGVGQQRFCVLMALLEGSVNLLASVTMVRVWGAMGVALGTLVGACLAVAGNVLYNMPRTTGIAVSRSSYVAACLGRPLLCFAPGALLTALLATHGASQAATACLWGVTTVTLIWSFGLTANERAALLSLPAIRKDQSTGVPREASVVPLGGTL